MTEEDLLRMAQALQVPVDRPLARAVLSEVERVIAAAHRLRELPLADEDPPIGDDADVAP
ncbi:MAG: hypothetical protein QN141_06200 [Armatimonadota bacterium]|nr:hypothetical protein [Armatimonadota bacterium]MDR7451912.1 hypothetical protein [Armatimonadota bacterium]MDR7466594.1 hypothetical protein [Armatimonadota bacterium]MDR7495084.1 hypothetical protein [Armatimonadota bacterium]MDR7500329.1 hypothetical protein [Armatimonadota bacterium]